VFAWRAIIILLDDVAFVYNFEIPDARFYIVFKRIRDILHHPFWLRVCHQLLEQMQYPIMIKLFVLILFRDQRLIGHYFIIGVFIH
jgi:hypothetical protein